MQKILKSKISQITKTPSQNIYFYFKGRIALYYLLKAANIQKDDEIIIQGFSCVAVANAIIQTAAKPVYVDISNATLNATLDTIKKSYTSSTKVIIIQNTFGLSSDVLEIKAFCEEKNLLLIEDCTHGFGGLYDGRANGVYAHGAFYSTQWSKPFTSGIGGIAIINNPEKFPLLKEATSISRPPLSKEFSLLIQNLTYSLLAHKFSLNILRNIYQFLYTHSIVTGSSTQQELEAPATELTEPWSMGFIQTMFALLRLNGLKKKMQIRKKLGIQINEAMKLHNKFHYGPSLISNHSFLRFPIIVKDKDKVINYLKKTYGIVPGDWFFSPIYPIEHNLDSWNYTECKNAEVICKKILNLPTDDKDVLKLIKDQKFLELIE